MNLRPISIGSLELCQKFGCTFLTSSPSLSSLVEYILIHSHPIDELETMTPEQFHALVKETKYQLPPDALERATAALTTQTEAIEQADFTTEKQKKTPFLATIRRIWHKSSPKQ